MIKKANLQNDSRNNAIFFKGIWCNMLQCDLYMMKIWGLLCNVYRNPTFLECSVYLECDLLHSFHLGYLQRLSWFSLRNTEEGKDSWFKDRTALLISRWEITWEVDCIHLWGSIRLHAILWIISVYYRM